MSITRMIEQRQTEIYNCKNKIYAIQAKRVKSRHDWDQVEVLRSAISRLEQEIDRMKSY